MKNTEIKIPKIKKSAADKIREQAWPYIKNFRTYIDIGACEGHTTNPFLENFDKIIAFEPNPEIFHLISNQAEKYNIGLGDEEKEMILWLPNGRENPAHGSLVRYDHGIQFPVKIKKLDDFDFKDVDFIKIDVEHFEMQVCLGGVNTIKKYMPTIYFENKRDEAEHVRLWLENLGYSTIKHKSDTVAYKE
jgi:FkbM family methyltransferase